MGGDPSSSLFGGSVGAGYRGAAWVGPGHGGAGVAGGVAATVFPGAGRIGFRRCRAERSSAAGPVPVDAGDGAGGTGGLGRLRVVVPQAGGVAAAGVCTEGSGGSVELSAWRSGAVRPVVPAGEDPGRRRPGLLSAGASGGGVLFSVHHRPDVAVADDTGSAGRDLVAARAAAGRGPAAAGLGQRGRHRPRRALRRRRGRVQRNAGNQDCAAEAVRSRSRKASSSAPTAIWRPRSCPAADSAPQQTSTASSLNGCRSPTAARSARWVPGRSS